MMNFTDLAPPDHPAPFIDQLRLAVAAYLAPFKCSSREHTESDLLCFLSWCAGRDLALAARRPHLELYVRRMQEIRRFKSSTVSAASPAKGSKRAAEHTQLPPTVTGFGAAGAPFLRALVQEYMADVLAGLLQLRDQASGLKAYGIQLGDGGPPESVAGLGAASQIALWEPGRPGKAVVEAHFVLDRDVTVDVLHDQCQSPSRELVPKLFG